MLAVGLSVIIPVYDDPHRLQLVLAGLGSQTRGGFEVIVVNDGGAQSLSQVVGAQSLSARYAYVEPPTAIFRAGLARNRGAQLACGERLLFLDGDCVPDRNVVAGHLRYGSLPVVVCGRRRRIPLGLVGGIGVADVGRLGDYPFLDDARFGRGWLSERDFLFSDVGCCESCHVSYPTAAFRELGGFWEELTGWGGEDIELAWRAGQLGLTMRARTDLVVYHLDHNRQLGARTTHQAKQRRVQEILIRSQALPGLKRNA